MELNEILRGKIALQILDDRFENLPVDFWQPMVYILLDPTNSSGKYSEYSFNHIKKNIEEYVKRNEIE